MARFRHPGSNAPATVMREECEPSPANSGPALDPRPSNKHCSQGRRLPLPTAAFLVPDYPRYRCSKNRRRPHAN